MTKLSVNLNKVALLRNSRTHGIPDVLHSARTALLAGADGITVHPRPDERHIRKTDVREIAAFLRKEAAPSIEFNIEGNPFLDLIDLVSEVRPAQCTLVPDAPQALTSDHGWDLRKEAERLSPILRQLQRQGIRVSLFLDPDLDQVRLAKAIGADRIELYTEPYAASYGTTQGEEIFQRYSDAALLAQDLGLGVNAGHDLSLQNLARLASIPGLLEVSIGHALIADALDMGLFAAVKAYLKVLGRS